MAGNSVVDNPKNPHDESKKKPTQPSRLCLRDIRSDKEGLLMLYPLNPDDEKAKNNDHEYISTDWEDMVDVCIR